MEQDSILFQTLALFGGMAVLALGALGLFIWWVRRMGAAQAPVKVLRSVRSGRRLLPPSSQDLHPIISDSGRRRRPARTRHDCSYAFPSPEPRAPSPDERQFSS